MTDLKADGADPVDDDRDAGAIGQARERIAAAGYHGHFEVERDHVWCAACRSKIATDEVRWRVIEMVTGQHRMTVVGGIQCPVCGERGTALNTLDLYIR